MRAYVQVIYESIKAFDFWVYKYPSTHLNSPNLLCIQAQLSMHLAFKPIDISSSNCVHMWVDIKHVNINACEHAIIIAFEHKSR